LMTSVVLQGTHSVYFSGMIVSRRRVPQDPQQAAGAQHDPSSPARTASGQKPMLAASSPNQRLYFIVTPPWTCAQVRLGTRLPSPKVCARSPLPSRQADPNAV